MGIMLFKSKHMRISFRNICGWLFACLLFAFGFVKRATKRAMKGEFILSIYFHKPSKAEFESCIKWFKKNQYTFISTAEVENIIRLGLPFPKGAVVLTVDDGWQSNEENIVEVANLYQVPVTIFVSTSPVEQGVYWWSYFLKARKRLIARPSLKMLKGLPDNERLKAVEKMKEQLSLEREAMTVEQIKRISDSNYVTIGAHTHSHPILPNCSEAQLYLELELSRTNLESWTGKKVTSFAYPNGDYGVREVKALQDLKYGIAFCSDPKYLTPDSLSGAYCLPRFGFLEGASFAENICRIVGVWQPLMRSFKKPFPLNRKISTQPSSSPDAGKKLVVQ